MHKIGTSVTKSLITTSLILIVAIYRSHWMDIAMANESEPSKLEVQIDAAKDSLQLTTLSNGCTSATDFGFRQTDDGQIVATRILPDRCRRKPFVVIFEYSLSRICRRIELANADTSVIVEGIRI